MQDVHSIPDSAVLFFSPNFMWLLVALFNYYVFPYDLAAAAKGYAVDWIAYRAAINLSIVFAYAGFWHVSLYWLGLGQRPFRADRKWNWAKVLHNVHYNVLAALQWTIWEALMMRCWATGRMPYLDDATAFGSAAGATNFLLSCFWVPVWRSWHFYFAHRLLHVRPLYKYVHSLHHRNTDIEPFAGLCMHPVEHLYYFACAAPSLYVFASPFAFMWNGVHLLISPAASHSGYEDHFQSDQFHYLHHKHFECNYGPSDCPLDKWFGTFRERLEPPRKATLATGEAATIDAKSTLLGLPDAPALAFNVLAVIAPSWALYTTASARTSSALSGWAFPPLASGAQSVAFFVACGPIVVASGLLAITEMNAIGRAGLRKTFAAPFHKERAVGALGLHLFVGAAVTAIPAYHLVQMALDEPGKGAYCVLFGC